MLDLDKIMSKCLDLAIKGQLVPQDPNDEPASELLKKIKIKKDQLIAEKKIKKNPNESLIFRGDDGLFYEKIDSQISCIQDQIPFLIPQNWYICSIENIANIYTGNSISQSDKETKYQSLNDGYNFIATKDVNFDHTINYNNGVIIPYNEPKFKIAKCHSSLLCIEGGSAGRKIAFIDQDVCFGNKLCCFYSDFIDNKYLYYYLQTPLFKNLFYGSLQGIIGGTGINKIKQMLLIIPPLEEQHRIVEKLDLIQSSINQAKRVQKNITEEIVPRIKKKILDLAIKGQLVPQDPNDEPASELLKKIKKEKDQLIAKKKIKKNPNESLIFRGDDGLFYEKIGSTTKCIQEEIPFDIPNNWQLARLSSISTLITKGTTPKEFDNSYTSSANVIFLRAENVVGFKTINIKNCKYITNDVHIGFLKRSILNYNDILITIAGTLGRTALVYDVPLPINVNQAISIVRTFYNLISNEYLIYALNSNFIQKSLLVQTKTTAIPNLTLEIISNCLIPIPPLQEQHRIVNKIEALFKEIEKLQQS